MSMVVAGHGVNFLWNSAECNGSGILVSMILSKKGWFSAFCGLSIEGKCSIVKWSMVMGRDLHDRGQEAVSGKDGSFCCI